MDRKEIVAEIRNKLAPSKTALDKLSKNEVVPAKFLDMALKELDKAIKLLEDLDH